MQQKSQSPINQSQPVESTQQQPQEPAAGKKKTGESLALKAYKQPLFILDTHQEMKFRTDPKQGAFMKAIGGTEQSIPPTSDPLHQAFIGGEEITQEQYEAD